MQNNSANKGIFHFWGIRIWTPMLVYWYEICSGYVIDMEGYQEMFFLNFYVGWFDQPQL